MDFFTPYSRSGLLSRVVCLLLGLLLAAGAVRAQSAVEVGQVELERSEDGLQLSAQMQFELPPNVEEALLKGIPMVFVSSAEIVQERWYWSDKRVSLTERHMRLAFQPLTRRWRLNVGASAAATSGVGLALSQNFDTLPQALSVIKRIAKWRVADLQGLEPSKAYRLNFRFKLDLAQLPRPFLIGAIGQSEWDISASVVMPLDPENIQ